MNSVDLTPGVEQAWTNFITFLPKLAMAVGVALNYFGFNAVKMLFWSAVVNGVLAPPLIVLVVLLTSDRSVMGDHVSPPLLKWLGWITAAVMTAAAVAMFVAG